VRHSMETDVVVVGLGAMGSMALWRLARRGVRVAGVEQFVPGHAHGSSHGGSRIFRVAVFEGAAYVPVAQLALRLWRELERDSGEELLVSTGALMFGPPDSDVVTGTLRAVEQFDLPHERYGDPGEAAVRVRRHRRGRARLRRRRAAAGTGHPGRLPGGGPDGRGDPAVRGRTQAGRGPRRRACRHRRHHGPGPARHCGRRRLDQPVAAWRPAAAGGAAGRHGLVRRLARPEDNPPEVGEGETAPHRAFCRAMFPDLHPCPAHVQVCLTTYTPDGDFVVGQLPGAGPVTVMAGFSGHGFKHAAGLGEIAAQLAADGGSGYDLSPFRADRFTRAPGALA
jgi:sarcosine oxidase